MARAVEIVLEVDAATRRTNPGDLGLGIVLLDTYGQVLHEAAIDPQIFASNNVGEYMALIEGMKLASSVIPGISTLHVLSDSTLVVNQVSGKWGFRDMNLKAMAEEVWDLSWQFPRMTIGWTKREFNQHADKLSKAALEGTFLPRLLDRSALGKVEYPFQPHQDRNYVIRSVDEE